MRYIKLFEDFQSSDNIVKVDDTIDDSSNLFPYEDRTGECDGEKCLAEEECESEEEGSEEDETTNIIQKAVHSESTNESINKPTIKKDPFE